MKTIGLLGGMSWESTVTYYQLINEGVKKALGGLHSAKILLYSVEFAQIEEMQAAGEWDKAAQVLCDAARALERGGAGFILICTNTMHKVAPQVRAAVGIPLVHIAEATAEALLEKGIAKVGLLGTRYTMTQEFYRDKLIEAGLEVVTPKDADMDIVHDVIYNELCMGIVKEDSKAEYVRIIDGLAAEGAQGVILGCTEIGLLIKQEDTALPVFDTTEIHAQRAVRFALEQETTK